MLINDLGCFKMFAEMVPFGHLPAACGAEGPHTVRRRKNR